MTWIKIKAGEEFPPKPFLYTDGKRIMLMDENMTLSEELGKEDLLSPRHATHYIPIPDLPHVCCSRKD